MSRRGWYATVAVVSVAGSLIGLGMRRVASSATGISFYPSNVEIKEARFQGEPLEVHFDLKNGSPASVTVTSLATSCGCMVLSGKDGPLKTPFELEKGGSLPINLNLSTGGRFGPQTFNLSAAVQQSDATALETSATVRVNILAALQADPRMIIFRRAKAGVELSAEVKLADALADPGVTIREVKASNEKTMRVEIQPDSGPSEIFDDEVAGRARATLKLIYVPDAAEGQVHEWISVVPVAKQYPELRIPVYCEIAERPFRFMPHGLTVPGATGASFRRTLAFVSDELPMTVSVLRSPRGVEVDIGESVGSRKMITIAGETSALANGTAEIVFLVNGQEVAFPMRTAPSD